jgi:hypothetical protein
MAKRQTRRPARGSTAAASASGTAAAQGGQPARPAAAAAMPAWVPAVVYAAVTVLLFREFFLSGVSMLGMDSIALSYFARNFYTEFVQTFHRMPYWNPLLFGGLPFVEGMHGDIFYPPSLALFFMDARTMWGWKMGLHIFLAGIFTYLWLHRGLRLDRLPAFFGGLVYMMGADLVSLVLPGGDGKLFVSTLAPLLVWLAERAVRGRTPADFAVFALGIALILFTSHMQAAYYVVWGVSLYFLFRVWQLWRVERSGGLAARLVGLYALAGLLGVGAAAVQFLPPLGYLREHSHRVDRAEERGYEWSSTYSLNAEEIASLVVPEFVGEIAQSSRVRPAGGYWGKNPFKGNHEYAGLVPLLLIPVLLLRRRTPQVLFFVGLAALSLLYALAASTPLGRVFYLIPGVSLFRSWSIIIFLYGLSIATLGAIGAQQLQDWLTGVDPGRTRVGGAGTSSERLDGPAVARRALWAAAGALGVLGVLASAGVLLDVWTALFYRDMHPSREAALMANGSYIQTGFWISFGLAAAVAGAWELGSRGLIGARALLLLLAGLAAADLYRVGRPFVQHTALINEQIAGSTLLQPDDVIAQLQRLRDAGGVFRVMDLGPSYNQNDLAIHGLEQLAGHHGNEMGRYRNLIGGEHADYMLPSELRLGNITNTEYFILPGRVEHAALEEVYVGAAAAVYRNVNALPRAFLAGATEVLSGPAAIERLLAEDFDARSTVILEEPLPADVEVQPGAAGVVEWLERGTDAFSLRVAPDRHALLVVLDNHYPAWQALLDGRRVPIYRANYTFRAVAVPPGEHVVTFRFDPVALRGGAIVSLAVLGLLLAVIGAGIVSDRRRARSAGS